MAPALKIGSLAAVLAAGALGIGLAGRGAVVPAPVDPETAALQRQIDELRAAHEAAQADLAAARHQAGVLDDTVGRLRTDWARLDQDYRAALTRQNAAEDALARAQARAEDEGAELARLRREVFLLKAQEVVPAPEVTLPAATPTPLPPQRLHGAGASSAAVLSADPHSRVVALAYGRRHGAEERQQLTLSRDGHNIGTLVLTAVRADFSVALMLGGAVEALSPGDTPAIRVESP